MARKPATPAKIAGTMQFSDGLLNVASGMGTDLDKLANTYFSVREITRAELDNAFRGDWIAKKGVLIPAFDATREWRSWQADSKEITLLENTEKSLGLQLKMLGALTRSRLYGGSAVIIGVNDGDQSKELKPENVKKGDLKFVHVVSRHDINCGPPITDLSSPWYGEPEYYERTNADTSASVRLHPSRVVRFTGQERMDQMNTGDGWGDSVLQSVADAIKATGTVTNTVAQLVAEAKIDVINVPGLTENMGNQAYEEKVKRRFGLANVMKSIYHILLLDGNETWNRQTTNFSGTPDIVKMYLLIASGALDIPATRFLSQSPAGLSATGDSDIRNYYDSVRSEQTLRVTPPMNRLDEVMIRSTLGARPEELFYEWNSLWQVDDSARTDVEVKKSTVFKTDLDSGLFPEEVLRQARLNQVIETGLYPGLEQIVQDFEAENGTMAEVAEAEAAARVAALPKPIDPNNPPQAANQNEDPSSRVRAANQTDAAPRTLYVRRDVVNAKQIIAHFAAQGVENLLPASELHVTILYTTSMVDWMKAENESWQENDDGSIDIKPGGARMVDMFGPEQNVVVLLFSSSVLAYRHMRLREELGAAVTYDEYQPHISLSYDIGGVEVRNVKPYLGPIKLGPEIFEEVKEGYKPGGDNNDE